MFKRISLLVCLATLFAVAGAAVDLPGSIKGTVRAITGGANSQSAPVPGARLTLRNANLPQFLLKKEADELGEFVFENLPAGKYVLTVEADGLPTITQTIDLTPGAALVLDVDMTIAVTESVVIKNEEGLLSTSESTVSNSVQARTLKTQPFREDEYESALPLTPGVVQDSASNAYVKGSRSGQSNYTVNGADVTDPITGESSFEIPLEAVANIQVEENPYSSEFGRFTGGVTNLQSKGGGSKFTISAARLFPTFHNVASTKIDSFRPRLTFGGPILKSRLFFLQSFEYRYRRDYVPSLAKPLDHTATERFSSFTQLDYTANNHNQFKFNFALFPQKVRFFGLNTFNPAMATPNTKQRGYLASLSEQAVFKNTSFLNSAISYKTSDLDVFPQGPQPFTLVSDFNRGNYFADTRRKSGRLQWQEFYYFTPFGADGKHTSKIGFEYDRTNITTLYRYNTIFLRDLSGVLTQRIDFTSPAANRYDYDEISAFLQDRWAVDPALTLDLGVRYDFDGVTKENNLSPRFSFIWTPSQKSRTVVRGGVGLFYDQTPPVKGYFNGSGVFGQSSVPERTVTTYAPDGITVIDGPRRFVNQIAGEIRSPRSVRWSLHLDQGITREFTLRFGYLQRETRNDLIVEPLLTGPNTGSLFSDSSGRSRYREFQVLANYINKKYGNWDISYTFSRTEGDLNTIDALVGDFPSFVIRPNEYSHLSFDSPHRFLAYGQVDLPFDLRVAPLLEYRTGFPYSAVNDRLDFVGPRNKAGRFPNYFSLDVSITKGFYVPFLNKKYHVRAGAALFDLTNHFNPRDVQNNVNNPFFGKFYNSLDFGIKAKFDIDF